MKFELLIIYFAGGFGGWSTRGCFLREESDTNATCECDHLTNFGILLVHSIVAVAWPYKISVS